MHIPLFEVVLPSQATRAGGVSLRYGLSWGISPNPDNKRLEISHFCDFKALYITLNFLTISIRYVCFYSDSMPFAVSLGMFAPGYGFQGLFHALRIARTWSGFIQK